MPKGLETKKLIDLETEESKTSVVRSPRKRMKCQIAIFNSIDSLLLSLVSNVPKIFLAKYEMA
jgi:hypothetical protein